MGKGWYRRAIAVVVCFCLLIVNMALAEGVTGENEGVVEETVLASVMTVKAVAAKSVSITEGSKANVNLGSKLQLHADVSPLEADGEPLKWTTSSKKIATVDQNGLVTPVKAGSVTIKVTTNNKKTDSIKVTVVDPTVATSVVLYDSGTIQLAIGSKLTLKALVEPSTAVTTLMWTSSSTKIAKVENGVVTPVKEGTATITVKTANGKKDTVKVQVFDPKKPQTVELNQSGTVQLALGGSLKLNATVSPATAETTLKWSSSSTKIAKVQDGVVTPVKEGTATITVKTANGKKDTVKVQVFDPKKPTKVELAQSGTVTLDIDKTLNLNATVYPATAETTLTWISSSFRIATVKNGVVTPVGEGTATITVNTRNGKSDSVKVKVVDPYKPTKVELNESGTVTLDILQTLKLSANMEPANARSELTWTSSNTKIATVKDGEVRPMKAGTVTITVKTRNGKTDTVKVKVVDPYLPTKVELDASGTVKLDIDKTLKLNATMQPEIALSNLTWTSSNSKIATVNNGVVTPVKEGTATITVTTRNGKKDTVKVKVVDPYKPTKVELDASGTVTVEEGKTVTLKATLQPATAKTTLKWTSSNSKIATVENGVVKAVKAGTVTITVKTANGLKDTVKVKVVGVPWTPFPDYTELKSAICSVSGNYKDDNYASNWSKDHPVVKAIDGMQVRDDAWKNPSQDLIGGNWGYICGKTSNVELNNWGNGWTIVLKEGARYSIYGFTPGMTLNDAKKNDSQRSDVAFSGKAYLNYDGDMQQYVKTTNKLGYLDTWINIHYNPQTNIIKYVEYTYFIGN